MQLMRHRGQLACPHHRTNVDPQGIVGSLPKPHLPALSRRQHGVALEGWAINFLTGLMLSIVASVCSDPRLQCSRSGSGAATRWWRPHCLLVASDDVSPLLCMTLTKPYRNIGKYGLHENE